jgi:hypothetical protein
MSDRITIANLEAVVLRINKLLGKPETPWTKNANGVYVSNVGNYHLDGAYGGYALSEMVNTAGGVRDVFGGHMSKRELYYRMHAFIDGIEARAEQCS